MLFWFVLFIVAFAAMVAGIIYIISRVGKLSFLTKLTKKKRIAAATSIVLATFVIGYFGLGMVNAAIVVLYTLGAWLIADLIVLLTKKRGKILNYDRIVAIVLILIAMNFGWGWYQAHHVVATRFTVESAKAGDGLKVVQISDSHVGTTFDGEGFAREMEKVQAENPDVVVLTGDFVDDDTTKEDMLRSSEAFGNLKTKYGVYFIFGNHDKGYGDRGYDGNDVVKALEANGVKVLQDETVLIADNYYLIGRIDRSEEQMGSGRTPMDELIAPLDKSKYMIVLDHQPGDYANQEKAGVDLVLSGHTHGGQMIPMNFFVGLFGGNDMVKGVKQSGDTTFVVNSGISDWAVKFKTGCKAEYMVIDIK